ncbi:5'-AMP-activated protein kinase beta-2 subunit protein, putative isoform 1 [Hibiscus syriacus]|uniref:5'-AMP-activated protein kinase beta-2 subunit protein, putative isoform 1 n=1 Tax=Hibiscus syriacus TaxID=106335 RepID=A0A6A3AIN9_HIBSY|nr:5'-AMP-activated protein kinase beta-2 subunit protein, putative isoform 1 [Hibiscus syriacus]
MAAKLSIFSSLTAHIPLLPKSSSSASAFPCALTSSNTRLHRFKIHANLGEGELEPKGKKKFITRDEEPEQYWQTAGEREGENPMMTPLPYIIIFGRIDNCDNGS